MFDDDFDVFEFADVHFVGVDGEDPAGGGDAALVEAIDLDPGCPATAANATPLSGTHVPEAIVGEPSNRNPVDAPVF